VLNNIIQNDLNQRYQRWAFRQKGIDISKYFIDGNNFFNEKQVALFVYSFILGIL